MKCILETTLFPKRIVERMNKQTASLTYEPHHAKQKCQCLIIDPLYHSDQTGSLEGETKKVINIQHNLTGI